MCGLRTLSSVDPVVERVRSVSGISLCCSRARTGSEAGRASVEKLYFRTLMRSLDLEILSYVQTVDFSACQATPLGR